VDEALDALLGSEDGASIDVLLGSIVDETVDVFVGLENGVANETMLGRMVDDRATDGAKLGRKAGNALTKAVLGVKQGGIDGELVCRMVSDKLGAMLGFED